MGAESVGIGPPFRPSVPIRRFVTSSGRLQRRPRETRRKTPKSLVRADVETPTSSHRLVGLVEWATARF